MTSLKCKPEEAKACCCVDVGTIIDNSDLTVDFEQLYATEELAQQALAYLTEKARESETEPCQINSTIIKQDQGFLLKADFTFSCQAETMIFQLSTR